MIEIKPDPKHPRGGFAEVVVPGSAAGADPAMVAVYNSYQQKWLGPAGWQPNRAEFASRSSVQEGENLRLVIGPDIVNHIEEDTPIRVEVDGTGWDTYWPDNINSGPDEAVVGDIGGTGSAPEAKAPTAMVAPLEAANDPDTLSAIEVAGEDFDDDIDDADEDLDVGEKSTLPVLLGGLVVLIIAAVVAFYMFLQADEDVAGEPEPAPVAETVAVPQETSDECAVTALSRTEGGFAALAGKIRDCGGRLDADATLRFVENAAAQDDPDALSLFGALYDSGVTDTAIEEQIGLSFSDQPSRAAEYYARAVRAGSTDASDRLLAVCRRLLLKTDTLSQSAHEDYCK